MLGVCDWGFCVYREEHSACLGNAVGPNPSRREPSTCARCKNFAVSAQHRPYWVEQVQRHEALLNEPALPLQTLRIVRVRLDEARSLIRGIDVDTKRESKHDASRQRVILPAQRLPFGCVALWPRWFGRAPREMRIRR